MRILIVKTSSLGDVVHALPAVTDLRHAFPQAQIDWCVEDQFAAIPRLHPAIDRVIPCAIRRWRKQLWRVRTWREIRQFRHTLQAMDYDAVIDLQGLLKSALIAKQARGPKVGYAAESAREPMAAHYYDADFAIPKKIHAVERNRWLVAAALELPQDQALDYGITAEPLRADWLPPGPCMVLLTATSRNDKLWPEDHWQALGALLHAQGVRVVLPAGNPLERERAARLAQEIPESVLAPPLRIEELARLFAGSIGAIGVDTGLTHLAAALGRPVVALYTATDPGLT
ncbi:MAG TPA: lipopolysaccharide heptosyltransferase I, partial [Rhodocyclaceae bacterium]|nr:lipopolysaccharide heptosyltransferase I [Rhodocyclaceae bacterium]